MAFALQLPFFKSKPEEPQAAVPTQSFMDRIRNVGQSLKSVKPVDVAWMGSNVAIGIAASKIGAGVAAAIASAVGVTAVTSAAGVVAVGAVTAVTGGVISGLIRGAWAHYQEHRKVEHEAPRSWWNAFREESKAVYESKTLRQKMLWGSVISAASFGMASNVSTFLTDTETGRVVADKLKDSFARAASYFGDKVPMGVAVAVPARITAPEVVQEPIEEAMGLVEAKAELAAAHTPVQSPVQSHVQPQHDTPAQKTLPQAKLVVEQTTAEPPVNEKAERAVAIAKGSLAQDELTTTYTSERLRQLIKDTTGVDAPESATNTELAKQFHASNPEAFLKGIEQQAPQLKAEHVAASCETRIGTQKGDIDTNCHAFVREGAFKPEMAANDIVVIHNPNQADPQKGLRVLYRRAVSAIGGVVNREDTVGFLSRNVDEVVMDMAEAELKVAAPS